MQKHKQRVLIVEDSSDISGMYDIIMREAGYDTITAMDGPEAIRVYREHRCEIAIVDVMLQEGGINGFAVSAEIKKINPAAVVIIVTALQDDYTSARYLDSKANKILRKDVTGEEILSEIKYIQKKQEVISHNDAVPRPLISTWVVVGCALGLYVLLQFGWMMYQSATEASIQKMIAVEQQTRQAQFDQERQERLRDFGIALADKMTQDKEIAKISGFVQGSKK